MNDSRYDLVLFGATGFTGDLTARYLARNAPPTVRWAIAGRRRPALEELAEELADETDARAPEIVVADVEDRESLEAMARAARVVATTVGPFARFGEPLVEACIAGGAHYADITGEPSFVAGLLARHDAAARRAGVRIVSCCGFDSIPHDLGVFLAVEQLPGDRPIDAEGFVRVRGGAVSGGTWRSAVEAMARPQETLRALRRLEARRDDGGPPCGGRSVRSGPRRPRRERLVDGWVAPLPTIDPWIVLRSACALESYGPRFRYAHFLRVGSLPKLAVGAAALTGVGVLARIPPARKALLSVRPAGEGPSQERRERARFDVVIRARTRPGADDRADARSSVLVEVSGGDPGYDETAKMLAESALCLALDHDELPARAGVLTPAVAFEGRLIERLRAAGMRFDVVQ